MKKILLTFLFVFVALFACVSCGNDVPEAYKPILVQDGCYMSQDSSYVVIFPRNQHPAADGSFAAMYVQPSEYAGYQASVPFRLAQYSDSLGTAVVTINDSTLTLFTDGAATLGLVSDGDTLLFNKQPEVTTAPRSVAGNWVLMVAVNAYVSLKILNLTVNDDMSGEVHLNLDEQMLSMLLSMGGAMSGIDIGGQTEGVEWSELLQYIPTTFPGMMWYSAAAGIGVFVPDLQAIVDQMAIPQEMDIPEFSVFFTTPDGSTLRIRIGDYTLDLTRQ